MRRFDSNTLLVDASLQPPRLRKRGQHAVVLVARIDPVNDRRVFNVQRRVKRTSVLVVIQARDHRNGQQQSGEHKVHDGSSPGRGPMFQPPLLRASELAHHHYRVPRLAVTA